MKRRFLMAVLLGGAAASAAWAFKSLDKALAITLTLACLVAFVCLGLPHIGVKLLDSLILLARTFHWREQQGRHHAFAGVPLLIEDDGRYNWVSGSDLQRVLGTRDADDVLAARHAGRWRRDPRAGLMLRVDAVVDNLASAPGRLDPRTVHLRRYFEREVLFPAAQRRRRAGAG